MALFLEGQSVWSLAFSLIGATVALTSAAAGLGHARRLSLTSKASPLRGDFRWLVVCAALYFLLAVYSATVSVEASQIAYLLRNGEDIPGTPDSVFCEGVFLWEKREAPEPIRFNWLFETILGSFTLFGNKLTSITAVPGCIDVTLVSQLNGGITYDRLRRKQSSALIMIIAWRGDMDVLSSKYKAELKTLSSHGPVPVYRFADPSGTGHVIHLCSPGLYAFQDGWLDQGAADPVCVNTRAAKFLPWCSWMISLIVMGFAFHFLSHIHSMVGKADAVATVLKERQSRETPTSETDAAPPPTSSDSDAEQTSLLAILLGKGVGHRNRARDLKKPV
jgi:hypothetical protein